jgi:dTDP-4-dehydrorhamnose 3,5-epimerase
VGLTQHDPALLPAGVRRRPLTMHRDQRGTFTEIFRHAWHTGVTPVQWNAVSSGTGVLRGVHVHPRHDDYLIVLQGHASIGLRDLRQGSPTEGLAAVVDLRGDALTALGIPHGVAHGFYFHEPSVHIYAVSAYWDPSDELGCHWGRPCARDPVAEFLGDRLTATPPRGLSVPSWRN